MTTEATVYTRDQWEAAIRRWFPFVYEMDTHPVLEAMLVHLDPSGAQWVQQAFSNRAFEGDRSEESLFEDQIRTDLGHSTLLYWLLEGNEPLEDPPPKYMSAPWHALIAEGKGELWDPPFEWKSSGRWVVGQDSHWELVEERENSWVLQYPNHGMWLVEPLPPRTLEGYPGGVIQHYSISRFSKETPTPDRCV